MPTKDIRKNDGELIQEYNDMMSINSHNSNVRPEWNGSGDYIVKFTLYGNYTPVKTSSSTEVIM
jgi:hypothetical protein